MPPLPTPFRAVLGLVATAMDEAKHLPDRAIELPMLAVSTALQMSLRAQQRYAHLAAKGDEFLARRETTDEPPEWARFDEPLPHNTLGEPFASGDPAGWDGSSETGIGAGTETRAGAGAGATSLGEHLSAVPDPEPAAAPKPQRKTVRKPRNAKPSAFDAIGDD
jgi:hypothetical protein